MYIMVIVAAERLRTAHGGMCSGGLSRANRARAGGLRGVRAHTRRMEVRETRGSGGDSAGRTCDARK